MRRIILLAVSSWLLFAAWSIVFYWFWRSESRWLHGAWAAISLGSMFVLAVCLLVACVIRIYRDRRERRQSRLAIVGWFLIGTAPLAWFGGHWLDAGLAFKVRLPRRSTNVNRVLQTWLSSFCDGVTRFEYRRIAGQHVVLLDPVGYPDPPLLVSDMDQHIARMCDVLGAQPPESVAWVRGPVVPSLTGVAIGPWAITDVDQDPNTLTGLDRHEVAHTVISGLCGPDHNPPRLLLEGWAQSQSEDRSEIIRQLAHVYRTRSHFQVDELIEEPWYSGSRWPIYQYGGPFVVFLIEQFSGEKFLQLYRESRRSSFRADASRVLGVDWTKLEVEFWNWLELESQRIDAEHASEDDRPFTMEFAQGVSQQEDWDDLVARYAETHWTNLDFPRDVAFVVEAVADDPEYGGTFHRKMEAVFEGNQYWLTYQGPYDRSFVMMGNDTWANIRQDRDGVLTGVSGGNENRADVRSKAHYLTGMARNRFDCDPALTIPIGPEAIDSVRKFRCETLTRPSADSQLWHIKYRKWIVDDEDESTEVERAGEIWLDESNELAIRKRSFGQAEPPARYETEVDDYAEIGGLILPTKLTKRKSWKSDEATSSSVMIRVLSDTEAVAVRQRVQEIASSLDTGRSKLWFEYVWYLTHSQPIVGLLCVLIGAYELGRKTQGDPP